MAEPTELSTPIPPDDLIFLVSGHRDGANFARSRRPAVDTAIGYLAECGVDLGRLGAILDFGCGCGRILAGWEGRLAPATLLAGVDINPALVAFCQENIPFAVVTQCAPCPPLAFADASLDLVYVASVYTHLTVPPLLAWTGELARILRPGGIAMISFHGRWYAAQLAEEAPDAARQLETRGYHVRRYGTGAVGTNDCATYLTADFLSALLRGFDRLGLFVTTGRGPTDFGAWQDIAVFQRHAA